MNLNLTEPLEQIEKEVERYHREVMWNIVGNNSSFFFNKWIAWRRRRRKGRKRSRSWTECCRLKKCIRHYNQHNVWNLFRFWLKHTTGHCHFGDNQESRILGEYDVIDITADFLRCDENMLIMGENVLISLRFILKYSRVKCKTHWIYLKVFQPKRGRNIHEGSVVKC